MSIQYTCNEYREEMVLLGLRQRLVKENLTDEEKDEIKKEIKKIEKEMGM